MENIIIKEFTYSSFIEYANSTKRVNGADGRIRKSSVENEKSFTGTESYDEAMNLALYGWDTGIKELELERDLIVDGQMEFNHEIVGCSVDVGRFLSGVPDCMINFIDRIEREKPELIVYVNLTYSSFNDEKEAQKYAKKILEILVKVNQKYSIKLVGTFSTKNDRTLSIEKVVIKDFYQSFVLNNLAFSFHPSFFRRIWFRFAETTPYRGWGYGTPMEYSKMKYLLVKDKKDNIESWIFPSFQEFQLKWTEDDIFKF